MAIEKRVLVVGGGVLQCYMIHEAQTLGLRVLCTDSNPACPGATLADEFVALSTYDVAGHAVLGEQYQGRLAGVVTSGNDVAPAVAACALGAGVRGIPLEIARESHNKFLVRACLDEHDLHGYQPRWLFLDKEDSCAEIVRYIKADPWFPCIIKPLQERASRGVSILNTEEDVQQGVKHVLRYSDEFLIEELLVGTEHSVEIIRGENGEILFFNIVDRYFDYRSGVPLECSHVNPTRLPQQEQEAMLHMITQAAIALGVTWGPFKIDCMLTTDGPKILECTARLSGGFDAQWTSPVTNRNPQRLLLQLACGLPLDPQPPMAEAEGYGAAAAILIQRTGVLERITLPLWAHSAESLGDDRMDRDVVLMVNEGDQVHPAQHNGERAGYVLAHGSDYEATWALAQGIADAIADAMVIR